jgi:two-component system chemotaxis response regulator CheB
MSHCDIVVIGGSWGGMRAVSQILGALPGDFPAPVIVVLHRADDSTDALGDLLDRQAAITVREAEDKAVLAPGCVRLAPAGYHLLVEAGHCSLSTDAAVAYSRPSIDVSLESAAEAYGAGTVGVVLTGSNADGAAGLAAVRRAGGMAIVQDPATAERSAMPSAAIAAAHPQHILPLDAIARTLVSLAGAAA